MPVFLLSFLCASYFKGGDGAGNTVGIIQLPASEWQR